MFPGFNPIMELKRAFEVILLLITTFLLHQAQAADTIIKPGSVNNPANAGKMYLQTADNKLVPATVVYTTDGNGNLVPINSTIQNINVGTVGQGSSGNSSDPWYVRDVTTQGTLASILGKIDVNSSTRASEATLSSILGKLDVNLSSRATETTLASLNSKVTACNTGSVTVVSSSLPAGGATSANQSTANSSLASIDGKTPSLGQKTSANSSPVVIASDQSTIPVSNTNLDVALSTRATETTVATLAKESGGNLATAVTKLTSIDNKTPPLGQATMANSRPVAIASNQSTLPIDGTVDLRQADTTDVNGAVISGAGTSGTFSMAGYASLLLTLNVTAVSGTNPFLDVILQFSGDGGSTWNDSYTFKRITAVDGDSTTLLQAEGNRYRFRYVVGGTGSPTFTISVNATKRQTIGKVLHSLNDSTIQLNLINSVTPSMRGESCLNAAAHVIRTGGGGNASYTLQASFDKSNWQDATSAVTCNGTSICSIVAPPAAAFRYYRVSVSAGGGNAGGYVALMCTGG
jgi:hypothetical protein